MKRSITIGFIIIICFILQSTLFQYLALAGIVPNLLLIVTMSFGLMRGRREGMLVGFFSGLLIDVFFCQVLGPYAFIYMTMGYINGFFHRIYYVEDVLLPMITIAVNDFIFNLIIYIIFFLLRNRLDFGEYLVNIILPEMLYTMIVTLFFYKLLVRINKRLKISKEVNIHD